MANKCELCKVPARMYCDSDQASLCWDCDAKVHSANFLVAKHSRTLLCHVCHSPTPWTASGTNLCPTVSLCSTCLDESTQIKEEDMGNPQEILAMNDEGDESHTDDEYYDDDDDDDDDDDEEDGDNQVVPWSATPPPPPASSSSSEESFDGEKNVSLKRTRENNLSDLLSQDDPSCSSSQRNIGTTTSSVAAVMACNGGDEDTAFVDSISARPLKVKKIEANMSGRVHDGSICSGSAAVLESLRRFDAQSASSAAVIAGICKLSREPNAVDFDLIESP